MIPSSYGAVRAGGNVGPGRSNLLRKRPVGIAAVIDFSEVLSCRISHGRGKRRIPPWSRSGHLLHPPLVRMNGMPAMSTRRGSRTDAAIPRQQARLRTKTEFFVTITRHLKRARGPGRRHGRQGRSCNGAASIRGRLKALTVRDRA